MSIPATGGNPGAGIAELTDRELLELVNVKLDVQAVQLARFAELLDELAPLIERYTKNPAARFRRGPKNGG